LTRLILELGGDFKFETTCQWNTEEERLTFGEGSQMGRPSQLLSNEIKKVKFDPDKKVQFESVQDLITILKGKSS
jgi:hypothetical protein